MTWAGCGLDLDGIWAAYTFRADNAWILAPSLGRLGQMWKPLQEAALRWAGRRGGRLQQSTWAAIRREEHDARESVGHLSHA